MLSLCFCNLVCARHSGIQWALIFNSLIGRAAALRVATVFFTMSLSVGSIEDCSASCAEEASDDVLLLLKCTDACETFESFHLPDPTTSPIPTQTLVHLEGIAARNAATVTFQAVSGTRNFTTEEVHVFTCVCGTHDSVNDHLVIPKADLILTVTVL